MDINLDNICGKVVLLHFYKQTNEGFEYYGYKKEYDRFGDLINETEPKLISTILFAEQKKTCLFKRLINKLFNKTRVKK